MPAPRLPATPDEEILAAPDSRVAEIRSDEERIALVERELRAGFEQLADICPAVSVFGSARTPEGPSSSASTATSTSAWSSTTSSRAR